MSRHAVALKLFGIQVLQVNAAIIGNTAVSERFSQRFVGFGQIDILADDCDAHLAVAGMAQFFDNILPVGQVGRLGPDIQFLDHLVVKMFLVQGLGHGIDMFRIHYRDDILFGDITEQADLLFHIVRQVALAAAQQDVRLDTDLAQLHDRMLGRLGFQLARGAYVGNQRDMHVKRVAMTSIETELANRLQKRQRLDIADGTADLDNRHIGAPGVFNDLVLDLVGDVRDDLNRAPQVISAPFLGNNREIDLTGGKVALLGKHRAGIALVMPKVQIGLSAVIGNEHLAMLKRRHGTGINVNVRVKFLHCDTQSARLQQSAQRSGRQTLADRGNNAAGNKDKFGFHVNLLL